ncbi:MAG: ATP-binding cassette domain-containing protein [Pirellulales bacterium]|nr:ATP-binding cassette domain-containing protein [Pirellulales bacterium]
MNSIPENWENLAPEFRRVAECRFEPGETILTWVEPDLDDRLRYAKNLVVLTDRRLISVGPQGLDASPAAGELESTLRSWPCREEVQLRVREHGGAGALELFSPEGRLHSWRFTAAKSAAVHRLVQRFERVQEGEVAAEEESAEASETYCPSCGALLAPDQETCPECEAAKAKPAVQSLTRLWRFTRPRLGMFSLGFFLMLLSTAMGLVPPYMLKPLINNVFVPWQSGVSVPFSRVWIYLGILAGAALLTWLLSWARTYVLAWVSERVVADMRNKTYAHLQRLSLEYFGGKRTGDLISRISTDSDRISYFLQLHLLDFANDVLMLTMTSCVLFYMNAKLALATLLPIPFIAFLVHKVRSRLRHGFQSGSRAWSEMTSVLADTIPGIRVVKAFAQERREIDRFHAANDRVLQANDRVNTLWSVFRPTVILLTDIGQLVIWAFGAWLIFTAVRLPDGTWSFEVGTLVTFVAYISRFYGRLDSMSRMVSATQKAGASSQRIFAILDRVPGVADPVHPVPIQGLRGEVEFRDVCFQYATRRVLNDIALRIRPGEMIGLVGPSGSGKSTLVNLVCRFYDVSDGAILVDGVDIRWYALTDYRHRIGIVLQEPFLFFGTIAENIAYGCPDATRDEIVAAARAARAHDFILRLPDGYDSIVGERGQALSGGERQRISIARALLIDPKILILDEATSSVDTETEREIQLALENLIEGRTTIAIAHRLSTLRRADRLVVLEHGRIVEIGPHNELLGKLGTYARLYYAQQDMSGTTGDHELELSKSANGVVLDNGNAKAE